MLALLFFESLGSLCIKKERAHDCMSSKNVELERLEILPLGSRSLHLCIMLFLNWWYSLKILYMSSLTKHRILFFCMALQMLNCSEWLWLWGPCHDSFPSSQPPTSTPPPQHTLHLWIFLTILVLKYQNSCQKHLYCYCILIWKSSTVQPETTWNTGLLNISVY